MARAAIRPTKRSVSGESNLAGFSEPTPLPSEPSETSDASDDARYAHHVVELSSETTTPCRQLARRLQVTLNTLVQGAWAVLLNRQSGSADVVFGAAFAGRPTDLPGAESIVGPLGE